MAHLFPKSETLASILFPTSPSTSLPNTNSTTPTSCSNCLLIYSLNDANVFYKWLPSNTREKERNLHLAWPPDEYRGPPQLTH